jgi:acyl dehydratase
VTKDSVITDEMRNAIGVESEPSIFEIEKEPIRRFAESIGDTNPLYHDEAYAKAKGYRGLVAPPAFMGQYAFAVKFGMPKATFARPFVRQLNGGSEYEFHKPICSGDVISATTKTADVRERDGRMGKMLIIVTETTYTNQDGDLVAKSRGTGISY